VDILARDSSGLLHIVEVKSEGSWIRNIVSKNQLSRLRRVAEILSQREPIELIALVVSGDQIQKVSLE
jgi:hypothetical protein